ncbi:DUF5060 domain-containing protein [Pelagicoccus mobilis]|uniref:DUF5060 domain-containing protein n=1 Tax=Pelagicoccus mobilis TaxID=415221 RepID=A0A934RYL0_9BACT|nr:DUF5060 domain-containing protein [Pelagicoccus mobilis]MBK1877634.1 DUF5060 domain-containing protein [Pelagicoccus mobilis]
MKLRKLSFIAITVACLINSLAAANTTARWNPIDLEFKAKVAAGTEFDLDFSATFTGPENQKLTVPGFYDGDNRFIVRFAPPEEGEWTYLTSSSERSLAGKTGSLSVTPALPGKRGPVGISKSNPQKFAYADGSQYFPIGFELDWLFAIDAENGEDIPKTRSVIRHVRENGFNQIVMNVFAYDVNWPRDPKLPAKYDYGKPSVFPYGGDNTNPDFSTLDLEFFQRFDRVVEHLDEQGIIAHIMIYVWNKQVSWPEAESDADNRYFDYVVKRYQAFPNLIWDISKEATGYGHNDRQYIVDRITRLRALDGHDRLVTVHDYGYCNQYPDTVDFISIQNWKAEIHRVMRDVVTKHDKKPVFNIEHGGYEGGPYHVFTGTYLTPLSNLERAYKIIFAEASITHYWQDTSWNVVIHDIENLPAEDQPKLHYYRHMADFIEKQQVNDLVTTPDAASAGFCLSNKDDFYMHLLPADHDALVVRQRPGYENGTVHFTWFDPLTGEYEDGGTRPVEKWMRVHTPQPYQLRILLVQFKKD